MVTEWDKEITKKHTIKDMFDMKIKLKEKIIQAKNTLTEIKNICENVEPYLYSKVWDKEFKYKYGDYDNMIESDTEIERGFWRMFISFSGIKDFMTVKQIEKLEKEIESGSVPFSIAIAKRIREDMEEKAKDAIKNTIQEVFKTFTNTNYSKDWRVKKRDNCDKINANFRTSQPISYRDYSNRFDISYSFKGAFNDLETACCILDGKTKPRYPDTIDDKIRKSEQGQSVFENEYFEIKCYLNGNQKVRFKRLDILDKLNKYGSDSKNIGSGKKKTIFDI